MKFKNKYTILTIVLTLAAIVGLPIALFGHSDADIAEAEGTEEATTEVQSADIESSSTYQEETAAMEEEQQQKIDEENTKNAEIAAPVDIDVELPDYTDKTLIVVNPEERPNEENIVSEIDNTFIVKYDTEWETKEALTTYQSEEGTEAVSPDVQFTISENEETDTEEVQEGTEPQTETETEEVINEESSEVIDETLPEDSKTQTVDDVFGELKKAQQNAEQVEEESESETTDENTDEQSVDEKTDESEENTEADEEPYLVAILDTGVEEDAEVTERVSMLGDDGIDLNGHGTSMYNIIRESYDGDILSIKVADDNGHANLSNIYAGIQYAYEQGANVINLSMSAKTGYRSSVLESIITQAREAGSIVVVSAGNNGRNVKDYVPANFIDATVVGACDDEGNILDISNYGATIDYLVVADSTSEAAARLTAAIARNSWELKTYAYYIRRYINRIPDSEIFLNDYELTDEDKDVQIKDDIDSDFTTNYTRNNIGTVSTGVWYRLAYDISYNSAGYAFYETIDIYINSINRTDMTASIQWRHRAWTNASTDYYTSDELWYNNGSYWGTITTPRNYFKDSGYWYTTMSGSIQWGWNTFTMGCSFYRPGTVADAGGTFQLYIPHQYTETLHVYYQNADGSWSASSNANEWKSTTVTEGSAGYTWSGRDKDNTYFASTTSQSTANKGTKVGLGSHTVNRSETHTYYVHRRFTETLQVYYQKPDGSWETKISKSTDRQYGEAGYTWPGQAETWQWKKTDGVAAHTVTSSHNDVRYVYRRVYTCRLIVHRMDTSGNWQTEIDKSSSVLAEATSPLTWGGQAYNWEFYAGATSSSQSNTGASATLTTHKTNGNETHEYWVKRRQYQFDVNARLDGYNTNVGLIENKSFHKFTVKINGNVVATDVIDWCQNVYARATVEVTGISATNGAEKIGNATGTGVATNGIDSYKYIRYGTGDSTSRIFGQTNDGWDASTNTYQLRLNYITRTQITVSKQWLDENGFITDRPNSIPITIRGFKHENNQWTVFITQTKNLSKKADGSFDPIYFTGLPLGDAEEGSYVRYWVYEDNLMANDLPDSSYAAEFKNLNGNQIIYTSDSTGNATSGGKRVGTDTCWPTNFNYDVTVKNTYVDSNASLTITKTVKDKRGNEMDTKFVQYGDELHYTIHVTNNSMYAYYFHVTDKIPDSLTYVSSDHSGRNVGGTVTWDVPIKSGETVDLLLVVKSNSHDKKFVNQAHSYITHFTDSRTGKDSNVITNYSGHLNLVKVIDNYYEAYGAPAFIYEIRDTQGNKWCEMLQPEAEVGGKAYVMWDIPTGQAKTETYTIYEKENARYRFEQSTVDQGDMVEGKAATHTTSGDRQVDTDHN